MTSRQRLLNILTGRPADRIAWAPFLTYWWDQNRVAAAERLGEAGFTRSVGADLLIRGHRDRLARDRYEDLFPFRKSYGRTMVREHESGGRKETVYEAPVGALRVEHTYSQAGGTWFLTGHPVKNADDLRVLAYIVADIQMESHEDAYRQERLRNPDALYLPLITPFGKSAFQSMIEFWVGTVALCYLLEDEPEAVLQALGAMQNASAAAARLAARSPARAFISWEDTSTTNISPGWYEQYILPEINGWCDTLHESGKLYVQHACGHLGSLAPLIAASRIDAIESLSDPPTGNIGILEFAEWMPEHITLIGGIEPTFFAEADEERLRARVDLLCNRFKGKRFILANADSCPPDVDIRRFGVVTDQLARSLGCQPPPIARFSQATENQCCG